MSDFADLSEEVVEIGVVEEHAVFQPLLVQHVAADGEVAQDADGPLAELGGAGRVHPETDGDDGVEVVVLDRTGHLASTFQANYPEIPEGCRLREFAAGEDVLQVLTDGAHIHPEQGCDELLGEPDGFTLNPHFDATFPGLRGKDEELGGAVADLEFPFLAHSLNPILSKWRLTLASSSATSSVSCGIGVA